MFAIKSIRILRHDFHRLIPTMGRFLCWTIGTHDSFEASGNHDFQIPFGEHWIGILPCEDLALLGDANLSRKISRWLRENRRVGRAAAAADRAAPSVKEPQAHALFTGRRMQIALRLVQLPRAGEHAAIFVRIGVAEHDFLHSAPGVEHGLVLGGLPDTFHYRTGVAQSADRFE